MNEKFHTRQMGRTGLYTNAMALGCYSMSNAYGQRSDAESMQVIQAAIARGVNLIDTADFYGTGHNEELVGTALRGRWSEVLISSKFGYLRNADGSIALCSDPAYVKTACEASLRRLGADHIDFYFQHRLDPQVPIEDTVGAMQRLVAEGKVRHLGLCEVSERTLRRACAIHPISAVQKEYSLWTREVEDTFLDACDALGVTLMAFSPLARGMLTGKLRHRDQLEANDVRRKYPRFSEENFPRNLALVDRLGALAADLRTTTPRLALAWLLTRNPRLVAISGADTLAYLDENLAAQQLVLSQAVIDGISDIFAPGRIFGDRYHAAIMQMLDLS